MKSSYLFLPVLLLAASCDSSTDHALQSAPDADSNSVTFTLRTPARENVVYSRDGIHESDEYAINTLALYEYEVTEEGTVLNRIMKKDGNGKNALDMTENSDGGYTFSIVVPADNDGRKYSYKFVANDLTADPAIGSAFTDFSDTNAAFVLTDGLSADVFCTEGKGIAMTGVAKDSSGSEIITMAKGVKCEVILTRIVSRIDIRYQTPNLKVTSVTLSGAPSTGTLFPASEIPVYQPAACHTLALNTNTPLPEKFLSKLTEESGIETFEMKKAFYIYERQNSADNSLNVHIEYSVAANGLEDYKGYVDVPFCKTDGSGEYVAAVRNHLYTIVLGNGKDPISGKVTATLKVSDWNGVDIDEPLTDDDDPVKE